MFIYSLIAVCIQHSGGRSTSRGWLINFIVWDFVSIIADVALISVLAQTGLGNCVRNVTDYSALPVPELCSSINGFVQRWGRRDTAEY
jgi:hypothetical protein